MIRCIAIDDEPKALDIIKSHVSKIDFLHIADTFTDPFKAIRFIQENPVDLIFLDINMPDIDGIELIRHLKNKPLIIFTTAHSEYAIRSYELEAVDYLLKPFEFSRFLSAVNKVKDKINPVRSSSEADFFFVSSGNQKKKLIYSDILYIQGEGNYVMYFSISDKTIVRASISETMEILPSGLFIQIHRSTIVSLKWIDKVEDNHVYIQDKRLSISATYRELFMKRLTAKL